MLKVKQVRRDVFERFSAEESIDALLFKAITESVARNL